MLAGPQGRVLGSTGQGGPSSVTPGGQHSPRRPTPRGGVRPPGATSRTSGDRHGRPVRPTFAFARPEPLHVAVITPPWMELPPTGYGGIEAVCADLVVA